MSWSSNKPAYLWDEADILSLVANAVKESISLDYKASGALLKTDGKKNEISKDVSSFANSVGGVLVYGVAEDDNHLPTRIDDGFDPQELDRE